MEPKRLLPLIAIILTVLFILSCVEKDPESNDPIDSSCLEGVWKEKFPEDNFTKKLSFFENGTGEHRILPDSTRNFTWAIVNNIPTITYVDKAFDEWKFLLDCDEEKVTLRSIMYNKSEDLLTQTFNMKVTINGGSSIDVLATVVCSTMGGKDQFLITGQGDGIDAINLVFRGVSPTVGEHTLFYDLNTATFVNAEYTIGADAGIIRGHEYQGDCCGGGTISISEKTSTTITGTFDVENGGKTYHLTGSFAIPISGTACND